MRFIIRGSVSATQAIVAAFDWPPFKTDCWNSSVVLLPSQDERQNCDVCSKDVVCPQLFRVLPWPTCGKNASILDLTPMPLSPALILMGDWCA